MPRTVLRETTWQRVATRIALPVAIAIALLAWVFASPVGSSPDDDFHLNSAWCGMGERAGLCEETPTDGVMRVPIATDSSACYAFDREQSASCQNLGDSDGLELRSTDRGNFVSQYPPVFYSFASLFASPDVATSAVAMRIANVAIFIGMLAAVFLTLPQRYRAALVLPSVITLVPLGVFIVASNNPSSWAVTSACTTWVAYLGYLRVSGRRKVALGALAVVGAVLGAGARSDSAVYTLLALVLATFVAGRFSRRTALDSLLGVAIVALIVVLNIGSRSAGVATSGFGDSSAPIDSVGLVISNLLDMPYLWAGVFGMWSLGWLDTPMPPLVWAPALCAFVAVVFFAARNTSTKERLAVAALATALWVVPSQVLLLSQAAVGSEVQPRYLLPLLIIFAGFTSIAYGRSGLHLSRMQLTVVGASVAVANAIALHVNIRRYVTGADIRSVNLDVGTEWWWSGMPIGPMAVWVLGSAAFAVAVFLALRLLDHEVRSPAELRAS